MTHPIEILYEDNHLLAVNKPAGIATMGVEAGRTSVLEMAREYIKRRYQKPGNVYLGAMSRLDAPVTGVLLLARTSKAAARLTEQFRTRTVEKIYWALVPGTAPSEAELTDWLVSDERHRSVRVVAAGVASAQEARLRFRLRKTFDAVSWLEIELLTGRKHQIRVQLASRGWPILGDRKYGSRHPLAAGIALHARRLRFEHPTRGETIEIVAPLPSPWPRWVSNG